MMKCSTILGFLALSLPFASATPLHSQHEVASRARGDVDIHKRFSNAAFTVFDDGLGACGAWSKPGDYIVALNGDQFDNSHCFKHITISCNGQTVDATIVDMCPGCPYGGLDLSRGLFGRFTGDSTGILYGAWWFK